MQLHILGISAERLWHTIRDVHRRPPQNPWDPWEDVMAFAGTPSRNIVMVDCAAVHGQLHVCAITSDERLLHTIRLGPQKWQPWGDAGVVAGLSNYNIGELGVAGINGDLHVCVSAKQKPSGGLQINVWDLWHAIRFSNPPSWQPFHNVHGTSAGRPQSKAPWAEVTCGNVNGLLHMCAGANGELWHTIRDPQNQQQSWQPFADVGATQSNSPLINSVGIAGIGKSLHVCAQANGDPLHTILSWQSSFGNVRQAVDLTFTPKFRNVDCANVDGDLHVCSVTDAGTIVHTIRFSNPPGWQKQFGNVTAVVGGLGVKPGSFQRVSVAGV